MRREVAARAGGRCEYCRMPEWALLAGCEVDHVISRKQPICDVEIGASTANLCNLVNLAYYHGQPMKWDPARERFTGGTGDENWLDVPHREPLKVA